MWTYTTRVMIGQFPSLKHFFFFLARNSGISIDINLLITLKKKKFRSKSRYDYFIGKKQRKCLYPKSVSDILNIGNL